MENRPPSVDALARSLAGSGLPHPLLVDAARSAIAAGEHERAEEYASRAERQLKQRVINATGVLLHTNLGRAPVGASIEAGYSNLEFGLDTGRRGSRNEHAGRLLARCVGAETGLVVNNCAAAVMLALAALAAGRRVAVSRGELVEIGGGFRIPDVMAASGAVLTEVGTTNRTRRADYERAIDEYGDDLALLLKVHQSNYEIVGFTEEARLEQLVGLDRPLIVDLGSGLLDTSCPWLPGGPPNWLAGEPGVRQTLEAGADLVLFSGDKLLGGPQAGILVGDRELVRRCAAHPLMRAVRPGGLVLGVLQDLALTYLRRDGHEIPLWRMATLDVDTLKRRAAEIGHGRVVDLESVPGGGTMPTVSFPSAGLALPGDRAAELRAAPVPIVVRVHDDETHLDLRTVDPSDDPLIATTLAGMSPCT